MRIVLLLFTIIISITECLAQSEEDSTMTLLFIGDIMGHDTQIISAYDSSTNSYDYEDVFRPLKPILEKPDFTIANLEVTLAGEPHKGYPQFSSPDELALACKQNGMDVLVTANNHSCDRGGEGITRTLAVLDFYGLKHTGTFRDSIDRDSSNLLVLENDYIRIGLLNYTYGTNGLPAPPPTIVNLIDPDQMELDMKEASNQNLDKLIVFMHWGLEYQIHPNQKQIDVAKFLFDRGVDIIIGSHPHVLQRMDYFPADSLNKERLIAYSLGNFVSNQRKRRTDGGAMFEVRLKKQGGTTRIDDKGYYLTWVNKKRVGDKAKFEILPCLEVERNGFKSINKRAEVKMTEFLDDSRALLEEENHNVKEIDYSF
jgi:poly-gamma-glutamate synthesis protein (capsule biosynthesis protein)